MNHAVFCVMFKSWSNWCDDTPFLWLQIKYIAINHLTRLILVFSNMVPTKLEKLL